MGYKEKLYSSYVTTHIQHRKAAGDLQDFKRRARAYDQHYASFLPVDKSARIIDLGCGTGSIVWWLKQRGYTNVKGVDVSAEQVTVAHSLGLNSIRQGDVIEFLDSVEDEYDVIVARDLIEHFNKEEAFEIISSCRAKLVEFGVLIIQVPNAESPFFGRIRYGDFTHELAFTPSSIRQVLAAAGFNKIEVRSIPPAVTGVRSFLRFIAWKLLEPLLKSLIAIESPGGTKVVTMNLVAAASPMKQVPPGG